MVLFHFSSNTTLSHFKLHHLLFIILHSIHSNSTSIVLITSNIPFILPFHSIPYSHFIPFIQFTIFILITSITTIIHPFHSTHHTPFIPFIHSIHNTLFVIPIHMFSYYLVPSLSWNTHISLISIIFTSIYTSFFLFYSIHHQSTISSFHTPIKLRYSLFNPFILDSCISRLFYSFHSMIVWNGCRVW